MKKNILSILIILIILSFSVKGVDYSLSLGLDLNYTTINENKITYKEFGGLGVDFGFEGTWEINNLAYGVGAEYIPSLSINEKIIPSNNYSVMPLYLHGRYFLNQSPYYLLGRMGYSFNFGDEIIDNSGLYFGFGVGRSFSDFDIQLIYEGVQLKDSGYLYKIDEKIKYSGIFYDGALDLISLKFVYKFGKKEKDIVKKEKREEAIIEVEEEAVIEVEEEAVIEVEEKVVVEEKKIMELAIIEPTIIRELETPLIILDKNQFNNNEEIGFYIKSEEIDVKFESKLIKISDFEEVIFDWKVSNRKNVIENNLEEGIYQIVARISNEEGIKSDEVNVSFEIDRRGPDIQLENRIVGNKAIWHIDGDRDTIKLETYLNGEKIEIENSTYAFEASETGRYELLVKAYDSFGNVSESRSTAVVVVDVSNESREEFIAFAKGEKSLPVIVGYKANITELTKEQLKKVDDAIKVLNGLEGVLFIVGYTDSSGSEELNLKLSKERAEAVGSLIEKFVSGENTLEIKMVGRGETNFTSTNETTEGRRLNRRIEFEFKAKESQNQ